MSIQYGDNKYEEVGQYASVDLVFTGSKKSLVDRVSGNSLQFTRNTIGTYVDANGIIQTAAAGEPRYTYDPETGEELGLLVEESRTNLITRSTATGATNGVLGSGGALPSGWVIDQLQPGTTLEVVGSGTENGLTYVDIRFSGTTTTSNRTLIRPGSSFAVNGETYFLTAYTKLVSGTNNLTHTNFDVGALSLTSELKRNTGGIRTGITGTFFPRFDVGFNGTGQSYDLTIRFSAPQMELGSFPTSYIPTSGSTVTRDPDTVTLTNNNLYDNSQYDIISDPFGMVSGSDTLTLLQSNSANSTLKRATIFSTNITRNRINNFVEKTDEFWRWRVFGTSFRLSNFETTGQVTVDWGDGTVETLTTSEHTFTNGGGFHEIGFRLDSGTYFRPQLYLDADNREKLIATGPTPESMVVSLEYSFRECINLTAMDSNIYNSGYSRSIVLACAKLRSFPRIENVNRLDYAWTSATGLTKFPLLDTSNVNYFSGAWSGCTGLTEFPAIDTSNAISLYQSWFGCSNLQSFPLIDTSSGPDIRGAWRLCSSLTSFPTIDTSSCTSFDQAWMNCSGLTTFPLLDSSSSTDFRNAWQGCSGLTTFPSLNLSSGTRFDYAWAFCSSLTDFPANLFDNCTTQFANSAFNNTWGACTSLTSTSVENILNSISVSAASGTSPASGTGINISYNASSGTPDITVPAVDLIAKGWVPTLNGSAKNNAYSSDFATLDLDFATNLSLTDNISGNNLVTFSRSSIGTYVDSNGVIQTATANTPRFDHDPDTLECLGLLVEENRTNSLSNSANFTTGWSNINTTTSVNSTFPFFTANNVIKITPNTSNTNQHSYNFNQTPVTSSSATFSVFAKMDGYRYLWFRSDGASGGAVFDLQDGVTSTTVNGTSTIQSFSNGWYRCSFTGSFSNGLASRLGVSINTSFNGYPITSFAGDGSSGILVSSPQLEVGSFPTSYIPTSGSTVTRTPDFASITGTNFSSWYNQTEGTAFVDNSKSTFKTFNFSAEPIIGFDGSGGWFNNQQEWGISYRDSTNTWEGRVYGAGSSLISGTSQVILFGSYPSPKIAMALSVSDGVRICADGNLDVYNSSITGMPTINQLVFQRSTPTRSTHISRFAYWPKRLTNKSLQYLTQ